MNRFALVGVALAAAVVVAAPAQATPATDPTTLPRGAAPHLSWLGGRSIHTAAGHVVAVPVKPGDASHLRLLGRSRGEWVVVDYGYRDRVLAIRDGRARTVWSKVDYEPDTTYSLARGGDTVIQWYEDRGSTTTATAFDLAGKRLSERTWNDWGQILDFVGDEAVLGFRHTQTWTAGQAPVRIAGYTYAADLRRDVLFVLGHHDTWGPTSLNAPGMPPWTADFVPRVVSPDGQWVAGFDDSYHRLQVRSMADGSLAPVTIGRLAGDTVAWEPDGHVLVEVRTELGSALVRCGVDGGCERATRWMKGQSINVPYSMQSFGEY